MTFLKIVASVAGRFPVMFSITAAHRSENEAEFPEEATAMEENRGGDERDLVKKDD